MIIQKGCIWGVIIAQSILACVAFVSFPRAWEARESAKAKRATGVICDSGTGSHIIIGQGYLIPGTLLCWRSLAFRIEAYEN